MKQDFPPRIFVTGTDTGVGKTVLSAMLCCGLGADYWKPVQSGKDPVTDTEQIRRWTALPSHHFHNESYLLDRPMSPHAAAEAENVEIRMEAFTLPKSENRYLVVEGAGGVLVPLNREKMIPDLIRQLDLPVLLVARSGLGTINHTMLSIRILETYGIKLWGVVLNGTRHDSNEDAIRHFGKVDRLYRTAPMATVTYEGLLEAFKQTFKKNLV